MLNVQTLNHGFTYMMVSIFIGIMLENILTIVVMCSHQSLRTKTNYILISLAIVDCLTGILTSYLLISMMTEMISKSQLCTIAFACINFSAVNSLLHLAIVTLDRFIAIVYPLHYDTYLSTRRVVGCIIFCWIASLIIIISFSSENASLGRAQHLHCRTIKHMQYTLLFTVGLISFILILAYMKIYKEILKQQARIHIVDNDQTGNNSSTVKAAKLILLTSGCFFTS